MWHWLTLWNPLAMLWEWFVTHQLFADPEGIRYLGATVGVAVWGLASRMLAEFTNRRLGTMTLWWVLFFFFNFYAFAFYVLLEINLTIVQRNFAVGRRIQRNPKSIRDLVGSAIVSLEPTESEEPELLRLVKNNEFEKAFRLLNRKIDIASENNDSATESRYRGLIEWVKSVKENTEYQRYLKNQPF